MTANSSAVQVDVSSYFQDPDGDPLTYTARSNNTNVATVSRSGSQVTITPVRAGNGSITITASDGRLAAEQNISVTVTNRTPEPPVPPGYLDETKSKQWLKTHDYQIEKTKDGYIVKKRGVTSGRTVIDKNYKLYDQPPIEKYPLEEGVTLMYQNGKIYISKK